MINDRENCYLDGVDDSDWALDVDGLGEVELVLGRGLAEVLAHDADATIPDNDDTSRLLKQCSRSAFFIDDHRKCLRWLGSNSYRVLLNSEVEDVRINLFSPLD